MSQLTHWNPFKSLVRSAPLAEVDDLFRNFGIRPFLNKLEVPDIRLDVSEDNMTYTVKADIPGVNKEDIDIAVDGRQVIISATSAHKSEKKGETSLYTERSEGQVYRSFTLPVEVDSTNAQAHYENGVLDLTLPKKASGSDHRVKVS